jgi:hypothetical protein
VPIQIKPEVKSNVPRDLTIKFDESIGTSSNGTNHRLQHVLGLGTIWDRVIEELHQTDPNLSTELLIRAAARSQGVKRIGWRIRQEIVNAIRRVIGQ